MNKLFRIEELPYMTEVIKSSGIVQIIFELFFQRSFAGSFPDLHFSLHLQLSGFLFALVLLYLLGCELINVACWQSILAYCTQELLVCLEETCIFDEVIVTFDPLKLLGLLLHFVDHC